MLNNIEPKQKAIDLVTHFRPNAMTYWSDISGWDKESGAENAQECAVKCCEEMIQEISQISRNNNNGMSVRIKYWQDVKQEVESLNVGELTIMFKKHTS